MKRSSFFLIELISMVLVFSLCAAICVILLGHAWSISRKSERLTQAVYLAESAAARIQAGLPDPVPAEDGYAVLLEERKNEPGLVDTLITVTYDEDVIYSLTVTRQEAVT